MENTVQTTENSVRRIEKSAAPMRNSNLELFRIITMLLIVAHHYVVNSGLTGLSGPIFSQPFSGRSLFLLLFGAWGKTGINCFVLITGYFMCQSKISAKKFCKLFLEIEFYNIAIWFVFWIMGYETFSLKGIFFLLLPIRTISDGFTSCYLVFFLFIPFLNVLVRNLNEIQHIKLLALSVLVYVIIGTIPDFGIKMNYVSWFIVLYIIGSYIRLYEKDFLNNCKLWGWVSLALLLVSAASIVGRAWYIQTSGNLKDIYYLLSDSNKLLATAVAISSFLFFKNLKIKNSKWINTIAASSFGVLMIHANSDAMRRWLWVDLLNNVGMYNSPWLIVHAFGSVLGIYVVCTLIDYLRIQFIEKPFFKSWDKHLGKVCNRYVQFENKLFNKLERENNGGDTQ